MSPFHFVPPLLLAALFIAGPALACGPAESSRQSLLALADAGFADVADADAFALSLADCVDEVDPELRDRIGYEGLQSLLRAGRVSAPAIRALRDRLLAQLAPEADDTHGFARPFAALALAEVARVDRVTPLLDDDERQALLDAAIDYLGDISDYRGFDPVTGWRHGIAHGADWLLQLSLNPALGEDDLRRIVAAAFAASNPAEHAYRFGESTRLARPVLFAARRDLLPPIYWEQLFAAYVNTGDERWTDSYSSLAGLARLHNTRQFLLELYAATAASEQAPFAPVKEGARGALTRLP